MSAQDGKHNVIDSVCGMTIDPAQAAAHVAVDGRTLYFCSDSCKQKFDADPAKYLLEPGLTQKAATDGSHHTRSTADGAADRVDIPVNGMSCAACARRVEQGLANVPGVRKASVNFATNRPTVEYAPDVIVVKKDQPVRLAFTAMKPRHAANN